MDKTNPRMTKPGQYPTPKQIETWMGRDAYKYWRIVIQLIEQNYPNIFFPEWLFGGKKHGWSLRYKKGKSFCTLIPEKNRCALLIIFGKEERAKVEKIRNEFSACTRNAYDSATTYHDGKWLLLTVDSEQVVDDLKRFFEVKRKAKIHNSTGVRK